MNSSQICKFYFHMAMAAGFSYLIQTTARMPVNDAGQISWWWIMWKIISAQMKDQVGGQTDGPVDGPTLLNTCGSSILSHFPLYSIHKCLMKVSLAAQLLQNCLMSSSITFSKACRIRLDCIVIIAAGFHFEHTPAEIFIEMLRIADVVDEQRLLRRLENVCLNCA